MINLPKAWVVYLGNMSIINVDIDERACAEVMKRCGFATKREAINYALRSLATDTASLRETRPLRGIGWEGDLAEMRAKRTS